MQQHIKNKTTRKEFYMTSQKKNTLTQEILQSNISSSTKIELLNILSALYKKNSMSEQDTFRSLSIETQMELLK